MRARSMFAATVAVAALTGCPRDDPGPPAPAEDTPAEKTHALQTEAQREALRRLVPAFSKLAALEHPVTHATRMGTAPRMPPLSAAERGALHDAMDAASKEADGITPRLLEPADRAAAIAARFAINRVRDGYTRQAPWVDDPTWVTREAGLVVSALETASRRAGRCEHCAHSLPALAEAMQAAAPLLAQTSAPRATAAAADARALAARLRALPGPPDDAAALALEGFADAVETLPTRAPTRLGPQTLQRQLEVEENVAVPPVDAFKSLGRAVATLAGMAKKRPPAPRGTPTAVTGERCEAAWASIEPLLDAQQALSAEGFACASFTAGAGTATFDDIGLTIEIVDTALVHTQRLRSQQALPEGIASLGGHIARSSQSQALRTALLLGTPALEAAAAHALEAELDAACLAAAALWVHGELGSDEDLDKRLSPHCPQETSSYILRAEARPRQAVEGLGLARVAQGPAGVVPLDKLWWLPLGLIDLIAKPPAPSQQQSGVRAVVEDIKPTSAPQEPAE